MKSASRRSRTRLAHRAQSGLFNFSVNLIWTRRSSLLGVSYKTLQTRRDYEIEGFTTDIQMLRKQIGILEKQILQGKPLQDQELQLLSMAKETGEKAEKIASHLHTLKVRHVFAQPGKDRH